MSTRIYPIVGSSYRQPAPIIMSHLPTNTPLILRREPTNRFDPNAIAVHIAAASIPSDDLDFNTALSRGGFSIWELKADDEFHLGYIPAALAAVICTDFPREDVAARFGINANGKPVAIWDRED